MCECVQTAQLNGEERGRLLRMFAAKPPGGLAEADIAFLKRLSIFPGACVSGGILAFASHSRTTVHEATAVETMNISPYWVA